ncbi:conserved hypothetical protein [Aspergillus lentulus]|nr:conserved hypothetical protein [Aspergillus lentulus]
MSPSWEQPFSVSPRWSYRHLACGFLPPFPTQRCSSPEWQLLPRYLPAFMSPGIWGIGYNVTPCHRPLCYQWVEPLESGGRHPILCRRAVSTALFCWGPTMFAILGRIGDVNTARVRNEDALQEWLVNIAHERSW